MPLIDPLALLGRTDKWYLGNAGMLIYAPPFPQHLDTPGFWDECHYGDLAVPRLLAVSFAWQAPPVRTGGVWHAAGPVELRPCLKTWTWHPDRIEATYGFCGYEQLADGRALGGIALSEIRQIGPDGTLHCILKLESRQAAPEGTLHIVAWTMRQRGTAERADAHSGFAWDGQALSYTQAVASRAHARGVSALPLRIVMSAGRVPDSVQITPSHSANAGPRLRFTPLWDSLKTGRLSDDINGTNILGSVVFAGLHWSEALGGGRSAALDVRVNVAPLSSSPGEPRSGRELQRAPGSAQTVPAAAWREFLSLVPHFECSDEMLTRYYWYRWYGLRLNTIPPGGNYAAPAVTEGIAYFRGVITYSLMCHIFECKWLADPSLAQGCLRNHLAHQTPAGHFAGHIYVNHVNDQGFYHTDAGGAAGELLLHHPDIQFAGEVDRALVKLLGYYTHQRDREQLSLYDVWDQYETGQEFTSRYFHADEQADLYGWDHKLRLKGVDVTYYVYRLVDFLRQRAQALGRNNDARRHSERLQRIRKAVQSRMWDPERRFFFDYSSDTERISPYWAAVGFYPLITGLASREQALAAGAHLLPGGRFDTPWPTPTVPADDPNFQADPRWRGERANCPWNGRIWPMVNSHIVEVLARLAAEDPRTYRPRLAWYLKRFVAMMFFEKAGRPGWPKDPGRPNCFEHYSPQDGTACDYRGIDDYMHSWVADLILKYVAGVRMSQDEDGTLQLLIDPMPFRLKHFLLRDCRLRGQRLDVCWNRSRNGREEPGYRVYLNNRLVFRAEKPEAWQATL